MSESNSKTYTPSPKYFIITSILVVITIGTYGVNFLYNSNQEFRVLYGLLVLAWLFIGVKLLRRFRVIVTDETLTIRYSKRSATVIDRSDIKGVHVKSREIILLLRDDKEYTIEHKRLKNNQELITLLQQSYPAAIPPANVLGAYTIEEKDPA
ncbi:MAG: hypothetical protein WBB45_09430 [Cyclobacteriaceae bacterium]